MALLLLLQGFLERRIIIFLALEKRNDSLIFLASIIIFSSIICYFSAEKILCDSVFHTFSMFFSIFFMLKNACLVNC